MRKKKIVCFGGGSALPQAVLEPLKAYPCEIVSVTSMTDDGGSTGALRKELDVLPPGDIRRHILAFSEAPEWKKGLWKLRFGGEEFEGGHKGHSFANVFIAGLSCNLKDYGEVLEVCRKFMEVPKHYRPLPATIGKVTLCAEMEDGSIIEGESEIDVPKLHDSDLRVRRVFLRPEAKAYAPVLEAIGSADALVIGPGDLYSSLLPCFLPKGIKKAIAASRAQKLLLCNIMNKRGETDGFTVGDFAAAVEEYIGIELDYVLYNKKVPLAETVTRSRAEDASLLDPVAAGDGLESGKYIGVDLLKNGTLDNDPKKTAANIWKLID